MYVTADPSCTDELVAFVRAKASKSKKAKAAARKKAQLEETLRELDIDGDDIRAGKVDVQAVFKAHGLTKSGKPRKSLKKKPSDSKTSNGSPQKRKNGSTTKEYFENEDTCSTQSPQSDAPAAIGEKEVEELANLLVLSASPAPERSMGRAPLPPGAGSTPVLVSTRRFRSAIAHHGVSPEVDFDSFEGVTEMEGFPSSRCEDSNAFSSNACTPGLNMFSPGGFTFSTSPFRRMISGTPGSQRGESSYCPPSGPTFNVTPMRHMIGFPEDTPLSEIGGDMSPSLFSPPQGSDVDHYNQTGEFCPSHSEKWSNLNLLANTSAQKAPNANEEEDVRSSVPPSSLCMELNGQGSATDDIIGCNEQDKSTGLSIITNKLNLRSAGNSPESVLKKRRAADSAVVACSASMTAQDTTDRSATISCGSPYSEQGAPAVAAHSSKRQTVVKQEDERGAETSLDESSDMNAFHIYNRADFDRGEENDVDDSQSLHNRLFDSSSLSQPSARTEAQQPPV